LNREILARGGGRRATTDAGFGLVSQRRVFGINQLKGQSNCHSDAALKHLWAFGLKPTDEDRLEERPRDDLTDARRGETSIPDKGTLRRVILRQRISRGVQRSSVPIQPFLNKSGKNHAPVLREGGYPIDQAVKQPC
jgi:hypothetical protein